MIKVSRRSISQAPLNHHLPIDLPALNEDIAPMPRAPWRDIFLGLLIMAGFFGGGVLAGWMLA